MSSQFLVAMIVMTIPFFYTSKIMLSVSSLLFIYDFFVSKINFVIYFMYLGIHAFYQIMKLLLELFSNSLPPWNVPPAE